MTVNELTPIIAPFLKLLRSRRFIVAVATLVVSLVIYAVPDLKELRAELTTILVALALALIGGYTLEDTAAAGREAAQQPVKPITDQVKDVISIGIDEATRKEIEQLVDQRVASFTQVINRSALKLEE